MRFLTKRLDIAEVVDPAIQPNRDQVFFGATVLYSDKAGEDHTVTIVGVDEAEPLAGKISWISPVARADQGQGRRHRGAAHAGRHRGTGYPGSTVSAGLMRILASKRLQVWHRRPLQERCDRGRGPAAGPQRRPMSGRRVSASGWPST